MAASISDASLVFVKDLLSIQWVEEGFIIASIGLAIILAHWGFVSVATRKPRKPCKLAESRPTLAHETSSCELPPPRKPAIRRSLKPEQSAAVTESRPAPRTSKDIIGVTDSRFVGQIVSYSRDEGYGFISCPQLYRLFQKDVFLHKLQSQEFGAGAIVSFGVFLNKNGHPQAKDLQAEQTAMISYHQGKIAAFRDPFMKRQSLNPNARPFEASPALELSNKQIVPSQNTASDAIAAKWTQWPPTWEKQSNTKHRWTPPGESNCDRRGSGEKRWVPKMKAGIVAGVDNKGQ